MTWRAPRAAIGMALLAGCWSTPPASQQPDLSNSRADWPAGFTWDTERYPQLKDVPLAADGMPVDNELRPGPDGLPGKLKLLLKLDEASLKRATPTRELAGDTPEPPPELRCDHRESPHACFVKVDGATTLIGAQSTETSAPGYDPEAYENEAPPHKVQVEPFWIMRFEADVALVLRCSGAGWCPPEPATRQAQGDGDGTQGAQGAQNAPARNITWSEAGRACSFIGARLPTEPEWELAARGTDGRRWPWGNLPACGVPYPHGSPILNKEMLGDPELEALMKPPCELPVPRSIGLGVGKSPYTLLAMAGNVAEWTSNLYAPYAESGYGPAEPGEQRRVVRGGGWLNADARDLRSSARIPAAAETPMPDVGFRCVWGSTDGN